MTQVEPEHDVIALTSEGRLVVPFELPGENQELMSHGHWQRLAEFLSNYLRDAGAAGERSNCCWFCCRRVQDTARLYAIHVYLLLFAVVFMSILLTILIFQTKWAFVASVAYVAIWPCAGGCVLFALPNFARRLWVDRRDGKWRHKLPEELEHDFAIDPASQQCFTFTVRWMDETDGYVLEVYSQPIGKAIARDVEAAWPDSQGPASGPARPVTFVEHREHPEHEENLTVRSATSTPRC